MTCYLAYGLYIGSELPLPELPECQQQQVDVVIRVGNVPTPVWAESLEELRYTIQSDVVFFYWESAGIVAVRGGHEIVVQPLSGASEQHVRLLLLGPAFAALLRQRDVLMLHGSGVAVNGNAVAFMGASGYGKSTMAAALHQRGYDLVADDEIAIRFQEEGQVLVLPAYPQLKLWPDALASLGESPDSLPRVYLDDEKRIRRARDRFWQTPLPLRTIYILEFSTHASIELLDPQDALKQLVGHSSRVEQLHAINPSSHFLQCARLAGSVPVKRLSRPRDLRLLAVLMEMVESDQ